MSSRGMSILLIFGCVATSGCRDATKAPMLPRFTATVAGLLDTTITGNGGYTLQFGDLHLWLASDDEGSSIIIGGPNTMVYPGEYPIGPGGASVTFAVGCCSDQDVALQATSGTVRILERSGTRIRGEIQMEGSGYIDMQSTSTFGYFTGAAEFEADVVPQRLP